MPISVLIVDDCPAMRKVIQRILGMSGFETSECLFAGNGIEALALLRQRKVDLVISDVNMAGMDGEGMLAQLTQDEELRGIPVLMVSSDSTRDRAERLVKMGARDYLVKPFHPEVLRAAVQKILESSNA